MQDIPVRHLEPNPWNANRMPEDLYQALKAHMNQGGKVDPLIVTRKPVPPVTPPPPYGYLIVDGEHRWRIAKELRWETIACEVIECTEDEAKREGYQRNKLRGTMDIYREAELFGSLLSSLGTQQKVAEYLGVSQQLVASRLSILKTDDKVRKLYEVTPRGVMTPSHLESIGTLPKERQAQIASEVLQEEMSVQRTERRVQHEKHLLEVEEKLRKAVEASQYKTCPECGAKPERETYQGLPWVVCETGKGKWQTHVWNLETGQTEQQYREALRRREREAKKAEAGEEPKPKQPPQSFRYTATPEEMGRKLTKRVLETMRDVATIETFRVTGTIKVGETTQELNIDFVAPHKAQWSGTENLTYSERVGGWAEKARAVSVFAEAKEYQKAPEDKSLVHGSIEPVEGPKDGYDAAVRMLEALRRFLDEL